MPPPRPLQKRMTANPIKPARYRPGKAVPEQSSSSEAESEDEEGDDEEPEISDQQSKQAATAQQQRQRQPPPKATSFKNVDLKERRLAAEREEMLRKAEEKAAREKMEREAGFVTESSAGEDDEEDEADDSDVIGGKQQRKAALRKKATQGGSSSEEDSDESDSDSDDSDASSSSSASSAPKLLRPVFIRKNQRQQPSAPGEPSSTTAQTTNSATTKSAQSEMQTQISETDALKTRRLAETDALIQAQLDARRAARLSAHLDWDADDTALATEEMIDDTDDLDPPAEHALWVARELSRLKRDRAALEEKEAEIAEVERRRALTTPERDAEDREKVERQQEEKRGRGKVEYMARYHHKGAFYQEEGESKGLAARDVMSARFVDQTGDKSGLPTYLQRRDETKIGKKGATRYRDMKSEDTGRFGGDLGGRGRGGARGGGGHVFGRGGAGGAGGLYHDRDDRRQRTGANASALGEKRKVALTSDLLREEAKRAKVN